VERNGQMGVQESIRRGGGKDAKVYPTGKNEMVRVLGTIQYIPFQY
jgi:hypothetical protein